MKPQNWILTVLLILFTLFPHSSASGQSNGDQKPENAEQIRQAGMMYYDSGEYEKAIEAYKRAIELNPDAEESYYHLGMAYSSLGRYKEAVKAYDRAIRIKKDYAAAHYNLGHAYSNLNQYDKAIRAFRQAIQYEPDNVEAYFALGNAYYDSGREEKAVDTFEEAIRRNPDNPYAYYNLGLLYFPAGPHARAVEAFTQSIVRDPRYTGAYFHRAYAYLLLGRGESAAADAETYLALKGWRNEHSLDLAVVAYFGHIQARQEAAARKTLEDAIRQGDPAAWPYPVIEYLLDETSPERLIGSAPDRAKQAQARAYVGLNLSLKGDQKGALGHLKWVKNHGRWGSLAFALAMSEIERIKSSSAVSIKK